MNLNLLQLNTARFISQRKKRQLLGKICLVSRFCHFQLNIYKFTSSFILTVTFTKGLYLLSTVFYSTVIRPRKKNMFLVRISTKKRAGVRYFFCCCCYFWLFYYFQLNAFFTHYYPTNLQSRIFFFWVLLKLISCWCCFIFNRSMIYKIFKMSASPKQQTNEWCWISQFWTRIVQLNFNLALVCYMRAIIIPS